MIIVDLEIGFFLSLIQLFCAFCVILILFLSKQAIRKWSSRPKARFNDENLELLPISLILPTWNEELIIEAKLDEVLSQDFPKEILEVIIIDANSNDSTVSLAEAWIKSNDAGDIFNIIVEDKRHGKSRSINRAFSEASPKSKILMMSDVDCRLEAGALRRVSSWFSDVRIGAVTGRQVILNDGESRQVSHEKNYRDFYTDLRIAESRLDSTPIFHGECSAYRRESLAGFQLIENSNADDSQMALAVRRSGYRAIYDPDLVFFEMAPPDGNSSRIQKVRRAQGLIRHFWRNKSLIFQSSMGDYRKILALEFSLHILLPVFVMLGFLSGVGHIGSIILEANKLGEVMRPANTIEYAMLFADFLVGGLLLCGSLGIPIPASGLCLSFLKYMVVLFEAQMLAVFGISLHKWTQVSAIRDALADHDERFS